MLKLWTGEAGDGMMKYMKSGSVETAQAPDLSIDHTQRTWQAKSIRDGGDQNSRGAKSDGGGEPLRSGQLEPTSKSLREEKRREEKRREEKRREEKRRGREEKRREEKRREEKRREEKRREEKRREEKDFNFKDMPAHTKVHCDTVPGTLVSPDTRPVAQQPQSLSEHGSQSDLSGCISPATLPACRRWSALTVQDRAACNQQPDRVNRLESSQSASMPVCFSVYPHTTSHFGFTSA
ncbi:hypothetical protein JZ751_020608 [Albula glossodonta]|uniref:Uncharacterized protein n=1 Tax=Albula glossodonta TaxID=121402 RepID=A0A8T2PI59_9TELE|nr:hypothetical protein JZ751_020608 [Albula glossodonta]